MNGKLEEAIAEYRTTLRLAPDDQAAHNNLGAILCDRKHDYDAAAVEFREAIRLKPDDVQAHYHLGNALMGQRKLSESIAEFREAIRLKPDHAEAHCNLGHALRRQGDYAGSLAELIKGHELGSKDDGWQYPSADWVAGGYSDLGLALSNQGRHNEAVAAGRTAVRLKPNSAIAHGNLGVALFHQGRVDAAIAEFREAIRLQPDFSQAHYNLANALSGQGETDEAIREYREVVRINPNHAEAYCNLAGALRERGDYAGALAMYRKGHDLGSQQAGWSYPSAQWVADADRAVALAPRLPAILRGEDTPKDAAEHLAFAQMAYDRKHFAFAARLYRGALSGRTKARRQPRGWVPLQRRLRSGLGRHRPGEGRAAPCRRSAC